MCASSCWNLLTLSRKTTTTKDINSMSLKLEESAFLKVPGKACKRTTEFVAMQYSKISNAEGQLSVRPCAVLEHQAMPWTVHGLQGEFLQ